MLNFFFFLKLHWCHADKLLKDVAEILRAGKACRNTDFKHFQIVFEQKPLQKLAEEGQLMSYIHKGFWQCMDTAREKQVLEKMLATGNAPWKKWED